MGGLITSTAKAEAEGKNSFSTDRLVREDIHNYSNYKGKSIALGLSTVLGGKTLGQEQDERFINVGDSGVGKTFGIGHAEKHKEGLTTGSINTANLTIHDDAGQRQLTGESAAEAAKNANRGITLEHVKERNGAASVSFDADKVTRDITSTAQVMQGFDGTTQGIKHDLRKQADAYRARGDEETAAKLDKLAIGVDMLKGGLTPADSALGTIANTAAPLVSYQIGQYAKAHGSEGSAGHIAAHAALAALTSAANGGSSTDMATSAGTAAAAELAAPLVAKGFYGTSDSSKLTAEQKETLSSILGLAAAGTGAMTGNSATAYGASKAVGNAIDDNFLGMEDKTRKAEIIDKAYKYRGGAEKYFEDHPDDSQELVEIFRKDADSDNLKNTMESGKPLSEFEYYQLMAYGMDARAQDMRAQQKDKTVVMGDYQFLFQTPVPLKPGTAVMNNDLSFVTTNGDIQKVLKRLDKISKLPQEERLYHREEQSYLYAYTNVPGNGYLKNAYKAPVIDQNLKLTNDTLAATAGVAGAAALAETAPAQMAMAGYGGWQIGDGSRDIYQGEYKQGAKKLFWGTLDTAFVGTSQWARAGKLGTIATDTGTAYKAVDTGWNSIAYTKAKYDNFRAGKNAVFGAAEYANTGKLASAEYLDNSKYAAGALKTVDNTASGVAKINKAETVGGNTAKIGENTKLQKTDIGQQDEIHPDIANLGINTPKYNEKLNEYINYRKPGSFYAEQAKRNYSIGNLESFKTQIESARNNIPKIKGWEKAREGGNVAVGEIFIEGNTNYTSRVFAHSRVNNPRFGFIGGETENFTYKILPVTGGNAVPRLIDSEYKILNHVANKLGDDTTAKGRVIIFTEKPACESCLDVKQQFMKKYPNIEVIIMDNKGEIIKPRPKRK